MQRVYRAPVQDVAELRQRLVETCTEFKQSVVHWMTSSAQRSVDEAIEHLIIVFAQKKVTSKFNSCCNASCIIVTILLSISFDDNLNIRKYIYELVKYDCFALFRLVYPHLTGDSFIHSLSLIQ